MEPNLNLPKRMTSSWRAACMEGIPPSPDRILPARHRLTFDELPTWVRAGRDPMRQE